MKKIRLILTSLLFPMIMSAQVQEKDTVLVAIQDLEGVVIEAPKMIRKADMDVLFPPKSTVDISKNGMQLLKNLMIPSLTVNDVLGSVTAAGQTVQLRINGRESTVDQVKNLLPETIKKVEWMDNPGLRYGGANYVINFIVENPTVGGALMVDGLSALNTGFGEYNIDLKLNSGRSQWDVGGENKLTHNLKSYRDYKEKFTYPDGSSLTRTETPLGGHLNNDMGYYWARYNYIKPDTTVIFVEAKMQANYNDLTDYKGRLSLSDGSEDIILNDISGGKGLTPQLNAYLEQHFANNQLLVVDLKASLYNGKSFSEYKEQLPESTTYLNDINTYIKDRNKAYSLEADYIKNWKSSKFTAGAAYTGNRNRSQYRYLDNAIYHQDQNKVYFFGEYLQRLSHFTFTGGLGAQYTQYKFKETDQGNSSWNLRPMATVTYTPVQGHQFRLNFTSWQTAPSLEQTNIAPQQIDGFQWRIGNPDLKTSNSYRLTFQYSYYNKRFSNSIGVRGYSSPNAITPLLQWEGDRLVTTYENSDGLQNAVFYVSPQVDVIPNWLSVSGHLQYVAERMRGTGYKLYNHNWSGYATMMVTHRGFVLSLMYQRAERGIYGEKISWSEDLNMISLSYNYKAWQFGTGMIMPFGKYDQGSKLLSKWNTNEQHMRIDMRIPYISLTYNLQWGKQKNGANKLIDTENSASKSSAGGR